LDLGIGRIFILVLRLVTWIQSQGSVIQNDRSGDCLVLCVWCSDSFADSVWCCRVVGGFALSLWEPSYSDMVWLSNLVKRMAIDGLWCLPDTGLVFQKISDTMLALVNNPDTDEAFECCARTVAVGLIAGILVV